MRLLLLSILFFLFCSFTVARLAISAAQPLPRIIFTVPDMVASANDSSGWLNIYIDNYNDTIAGFQFVLESLRPGLVRFDFTNQGFDTTGTLLSDFEWIQTIDKQGDQSQFWFRCIADLPFNGLGNPGIPVQQGGVALRIKYITSKFPGLGNDLVSLLEVTTPFDFSDPYGVSIGVVVDTSIDTTYLACQQWFNDSCLSWLIVDPDSTAFDSSAIDTTRFGFLDTTVVIAVDGSITLIPETCDNDASGEISITDLTCMVEFMFGSAVLNPCPLINCDADNSGEFDIADLTYLVAYMFGGGPRPL